MLNKISGLARALYIVLAIVAGFVALGMMNVALVLVVLGLIAGIAMPEDRLVLAAATVIALADHRRGAWHTSRRSARSSPPSCANLQLGVAGALASALAIRPVSSW